MTTEPTAPKGFASALVPTRATWVTDELAVLAVRAAYARRIRVAELPGKLRKRLDWRLREDMTEPATPEFLRFYTRVVQAMTPKPVEEPNDKERTCLATNEARTLFMEKMAGEDGFWSALQRARDEAATWYDAWIKNAQYAVTLRGPDAPVLATGLGRLPPHAVVSAARAAIDALGPALLGAGQSVALTMLREADAARDLLDQEHLLTALNYKTSDEMLKAEGFLLVPGADVFEVLLVDYVRRLHQIAQGTDVDDALLDQIVQLALLGKSIDWSHFKS